MPYEHTIDPERGLLVVHGRDTLGLVEVKEAALATLADPSFRSDLRILVDLTRLQRCDLYHEDVRHLAGFLDRYREEIGSARIALVAPVDAVYGVARMWLSLQPEWEAEVAVFRRLDEGLAWLGFPPDSVDSGPEPVDESPRRPA